MSLPEKLKTLRAQSKMTLMDLYLYTGLSISYLSDLERGRTSPSLKSLCKIANTYNITLSVLFDGVDNPYPYELVP